VLFYSYHFHLQKNDDRNRQSRAIQCHRYR
jgi:hypothetical protein